MARVIRNDDDDLVSVQMTLKMSEELYEELEKVSKRSGVEIEQLISVMLVLQLDPGEAEDEDDEPEKEF